MVYIGAGRWRWQTASNDPGLANQSGTVTVAPADSSSSNPFFSRGRLSVGDGHLKHADQSAFFWLGDTAWGESQYRNDSI